MPASNTKESNKSKIIPINYQGTCKRPKNHINCMAANEWIRLRDIRTISKDKQQ